MSTHPSLGPAPTLHTKRLRLRALRGADDPFLLALLTDPTVRAFLGGTIAKVDVPSHCQSYHTAARLVPFWTILCDQRQIGLVSLTPHKDGSDIELSYQFLPSAVGKGLAFEAIRAVLDHAKAVGLTRIIAETQLANARSVSLLDRLGMRAERQLERFGATQVIYAT